MHCNPELAKNPNGSSWGFFLSHFFLPQELWKKVTGPGKREATEVARAEALQTVMKVGCTKFTDVGTRPDKMC